MTYKDQFRMYLLLSAVSALWAESYDFPMLTWPWDSPHCPKELQTQGPLLSKAPELAGTLSFCCSGEGQPASGVRTQARDGLALPTLAFS